METLRLQFLTSFGKEISISDHFKHLLMNYKGYKIWCGKPVTQVLHGQLLLWTLRKKISTKKGCWLLTGLKLKQNKTNTHKNGA